MPHTGLESLITAAFEDRANITPATKGDVRHAVESALRLLDGGKLRVAEKIEGEDGPDSWRVNQWLKKAVLLSFRLNDMTVIDGGAGRRDLVGQGAVEIRRLGRERNMPAAGFRSVPGRRRSPLRLYRAGRDPDAVLRQSRRLMSTPARWSTPG